VALQRLDVGAQDAAVGARVQAGVAAVRVGFCGRAPGAGRLLLPIRTLPDGHDFPLPYAPAQPARARLVLVG
jgi:hypothetical protein